MTYTELIAAIQSYTENQFPDTYLASGSAVSATTQLNTFIQQAEQRIYNSVQFPSIRKNVTGNLTSGNKYLSAPDDFLSVYSLAVIDGSGNYEYLLNKDVNFIRQAYPNPTTDTGLPKYYALFGPTVNVSAVTDELSFIVGPTPDSSYSVELHYYYYPESITVAADGRTWLGDNFDSVLLYGSLVEAYTFMKGEADMIQLYNSKYMEALALAKRLGDGLERSDAYRSGQFRAAPLPQNNGVA
ncbi:hypothetical protein EBT31_00510 [bacterium]|nr:hypothetical protein [bacterium]